MLSGFAMGSGIPLALWEGDAGVDEVGAGAVTGSNATVAVSESVVAVERAAELVMVSVANR